MKLRGKEFGSVFSTPGALGFHGEGYWFHSILSLFGWSPRDSITLAYKCVTANSWNGNLPLRSNFRPRELLPRCILVNPWKCTTLNSVGWSNPGIRALLPIWVKYPHPAFIQIGTVGLTREIRLGEWRQLLYVMQRNLGSFEAPIAIQLAFGCHNINSMPAITPDEIAEVFCLFSSLDVPLAANLSPVVSDEWIVAAGSHPACDALWLTNTIPWGAGGIDWVKLFGSTTSPLQKRGFGPGTFSRPQAFPLHLNCLLRAKRMMREGTIRHLPLISGGAYDITQTYQLLMAGADGIAFGGTTRCRPWRTKHMVEFANHHFERCDEQR